MVAAQCVLVAPLMTALARPDDRGRARRVRRLTALAAREQAAADRHADPGGRFPLLTVASRRFGRAAAEVGAVMIVRGNIDGVTRVMTTTIALETSKGDLALALGWAWWLVLVILLVNGCAQGIRVYSARRYG